VKRNPKHTFVNSVWVPSARATMEINRGNGARAVALLDQALPGLYFNGMLYERGRAYLRAGKGAEAATEFNKLLGYRLMYLSFPDYSLLSLAHLGLARAHALSGDTGASRQAYQDFFALWKDADPDIPILKEAKAEYAKLQ